METGIGHLRFHPGKSLADRFSDVPSNRATPTMKRGDWYKDYCAISNRRASPTHSGSSSHLKLEVTVQANVAIEIIYREGPRMNQIRNMDNDPSGIEAWATLRQAITSDFHAGGLPSPSHKTYHILDNGHIFAYWPNDKSHMVKLLHDRLQQDDTRERLSERNVLAIYILEQCEAELCEIHFQSYVSNRGKESFYRNYGIVDKAIPTAPRAHFNLQQALVPVTESSTQGGVPNRLAASKINIGNSVVAQPFVPSKRSREDTDEAESPIQKKLSIDSSATICPPRDMTQIEDVNGNLGGVVGIEQMLRLAQAQMDNYLSAGAKSHFENNPSFALSTVQGACKDKVAFLELLLQSFKENLSQSQMLSEKVTSLTDLKMKLAQAEASETERQQSIRDQESFGKARLQMMEEQLEEAQREKEGALRLLDAAEERIQKIRRAASDHMKIAKEEKIAMEAELNGEHDRRVKAEETLTSVLETVFEMGIILGDPVLKLPKKFERKIRY